MTLAQLITDRRLSLEPFVSQARLGELLGVSRVTICNWETGIYLPNAEYLPLLQEHLGINSDDLLDAIAASREQAAS